MLYSNQAWNEKSHKLLGLSVHYIYVAMGKSWCLGRVIWCVWIWANWLTHSHIARVCISDLGRHLFHLFIIFLFLTLGSLFDSMWSLSLQKPELDTVYPNRLFNTTFPRRITSPASFRLYHVNCWSMDVHGSYVAIGGCWLIQKTVVMKWVSADKSRVCLAGVTW